MTIGSHFLVEGYFVSVAPFSSSTSRFCPVFLGGVCIHTWNPPKNNLMEQVHRDYSPSDMTAF